MNRPESRSGAADGIVFNIQKFSLHDGTGIRTLVFLKGCSLNCRWCANPEGKAPFTEVAYNKEKCIGPDQCEECYKVCLQGAILYRNDNHVDIDRHRCDNCGRCADRCPSKAIHLFGKRMRVDEVLNIVEEDGAFYNRSGGGLTLSGGEPLDQMEFSLEILRTAGKRGITTAVETSGLSRWENLAAICHHTDQMFYDIKTLDKEQHIMGTGVDNTLILENLDKLCRHFPNLPLTVRTPVIPGFNDSPAAIRAIRHFLSGISPEIVYELLPYHRFGEPKYQYLGLEYPLKDVSELAENRIEYLSQLIRPPM